MKITIKGGSNFDSILIVREGKLGLCHIRFNGETTVAEFPMPKGDGILEIDT